MKFKIALLVNLFLASVTLAIPSRLGERIAHRRANRQSKPISLVDAPDSAASSVVYSSSWSGAAWAESNGTFTTVTGTSTVPTLTGDNGAAAIWVGLDGYTCDNAILQIGIDITVSSSGTTYDACYEWYPDYAYDFSGITVSAGDVIVATVAAYSTTSGVAIIENRTTGVTVTQDLSSSYALCESNAEWIVEDFEEGGIVPLADFGTITISDATADSTYTPSGATVFEIEGVTEVLFTTSGDSLTIRYIG